MDTGRSKWLVRFTSRPMWYFSVAFVLSMVILWLALQMLSIWNSVGGAPDLKGIEVTSAAVQAVVGTAVVGASAIVALLIAVAALRASEQNNILNDPDYLLSHQARSDYLKFGFLYGTLISLYRAQKHESELASYIGEDAGNERISSVRWQPLVRDLRDLLSRTALQVAALEGAKARDQANEDQGLHEHVLRRMFSQVLETLEAEDDNLNTSLPAGTWVIRILAAMTLLGNELEEGLKAVSKLDAAQESSRGGLLGYMHRWAADTTFIRVDPSFARVITSTTIAEEAFLAGMTGVLPSPTAALSENLEQLMADHKNWKSGECTDPMSVGLHRAMRVAALIGDHSTVQDLSATAAEFAERQGLRPYAANIITKEDVEELAHLIKKDAGEGQNSFLVLTISRKRLPVLFHGNLINKDTRGCVIVDGLRSPHLAWLEEAVLAWLEEAVRKRLESQAQDYEAEAAQCNHCLNCDACGGCSRCGTCVGEVPRELDLMLNVLATRAYAGDGQWGDPSLGRIERDFPDLRRTPGKAELQSADGPAMMWIGIDYRQLGVEPPTRMDDCSCEMWSFFGRSNATVSNELRSLSQFR